jgi:hypothetical protein
LYGGVAFLLCVAGAVFLGGLIRVLCLEPGPIAVVDTFEKDLGKTWNDHFLEATFQISNGGSAPLDISILSRSCMCVQATLDRPVVDPGQKALLALMIDASEKEGKVDVNVTVHTNQRKQPDLVFHTQAETYSAFIPSLNAVNFRDVCSNQLPSRRRISLRLADEERDRGQEVFRPPTTSASYFSAAIVRSEQGNMVLEIVLGKESALGILQESVVLETVSGYHRTITVYAHVTGDISVVPETLFLEGLARGENTSRSCSIGNLNDGDTVQVVGVDGFSPSVLGLTLAGSGTTRSLVANVNVPMDCPGSLRGRAKLRVVKHTNETTDLEIPIIMSIAK